MPSRLTGPKGIASSTPMIMPTGIMKGLGMYDTAAWHHHQQGRRAPREHGAGTSTADTPSAGERLGCTGVLRMRHGARAAWRAFWLFLLAPFTLVHCLGVLPPAMAQTAKTKPNSKKKA